MKLPSIAAAVTVAAIGLGACQTVPQDETTATDEIMLIRERFISAFNRREWDDLRDLVTDDVVFMPPDAPPVTGVDAYVEAHRETTPPGTLDVVTAEIIEGGEIAYGIGNFNIDVLSADGTSLEQDGKWLIVFAQDATGAWRIHRHIWNNNAPLPPTP